MWWLLLGDVAAKGGAGTITWIGNTQLMGAASAVITGLLMRNAGQNSVWRIDTTNSNGRLIVIRETDGRLTVSPTTNQERKSINELLESWNGRVGHRPVTLERNQRFRLDLQGHTSDELFVNLQIQRNERRSGSRGRQQGGGGNSSSTTVAQIFIPTKVLDQVSREDIIAALEVSMDKEKAVVLTPKVEE